MARARNIKPGLYKNEDLAECSVWARLMFPGLWMLADREGRLEDRPKRIKGELFPFDNVEVDPLLAELERWNFISRYSQGGSKYIQIINFSRHQKPHSREKASEIPAIDGYKAPPSDDTETDEEVTKHNLGSDKAQPNQCQARPDSLIADCLIPDCLIPDPLQEQGAPEKTEIKKSTATASRLPAGWMPSDSEADFCKAERPDLNPSVVADRFRDYWIAQPGAKGRKLDWSATWRNWVRNEKAEARASPSYQNLTQTRTNTIAALTGQKKNERTITQERDITSECLRLA